MAFDSNSNLHVADNTAHSSHNTNDGQVMPIHDDAYKGLLNNPGNAIKDALGGKSVKDAIIEYFRPEPKIDITKSGDGLVKVSSVEATDKERADAEKKLEKGMSKLIPEADRQLMTSLTTAITSGDSKAFGEALKKAGGDPEKLRGIVEEVNKLLEAKGCSTKIDVTANGKVLVSDGSSDTALAFNPATGRAEAKRVEHGMDGSVTVKPGEVLHVDKDAVFASISNDAVASINGGGINQIGKYGDGGISGITGKPGFEPFKPGQDDPIKPWSRVPFWVDPKYSLDKPGNKRPSFEELQLNTYQPPNWYMQK